MKKIIIILVFLLTGCSSSSSITDSVYIASVGLDYEDNKYKGYFYLPSSVDVGGNITEDASAYIAEVESESIPDLFYQMTLKNNVYVNFKHISSIILTKNYFDNGDLELLINYFRDSPLFDFNFYVFSTEDSIKEIYELKNPNKEATIISMLLNPNDKIFEYLYALPIHYLTFANSFFLKRTIKIPLIKLESIWENDGEKSKGYYQKGVLLYDSKNSVISYDLGHTFLKNNKELEIFTEDINASLDDYKISISYNSFIELNISFKLRMLKGTLTLLEEYLKNIIINTMTNTNKEIDLLNLNYYSKQLNKSISNEKIIFKLDIKK